MREKAIEICKNIISTIKKIEHKPITTITYIRDDMFSVPTASVYDLKKKLKYIKNKYILTERDLL